MKKLAYKLLAQNRKDMVEKLIKIHAFDARFPLKQGNCQWLYMLDPPIYDFAFEVHFKDGSKKLLHDADALKLLDEEMKYSEKALQENEDHLKNLERFNKFGPLKKRFAPLNPEPHISPVVERVSSDPADPTPAVIPEEKPDLEPTAFDVDAGVVTLEAITVKARLNEHGIAATASVKNTNLFTAQFSNEGKLKWLSDVKCSTNAKFFEENYHKLFQE